jgi:cob(I)alamin adenosyltransferase
MGNRLSKIYTRTGDNGTTGLGDGSRIDKDAPRIEAIGDIDELNSVIGLMLAESLPDQLRTILLEVQHRLFDIGGGLSMPGTDIPANNLVEGLEQALDKMNDELEPLKEFILPGGTHAAALCHLARSVCRRAERRVISLAKSEAIPELPVKYLNRLSDLLFVMARTINKEAGITDVFWQSERMKK